MYSAAVYASGNRDGSVRTFYIETYSWPAIRAALAGVREDFAWIYGGDNGLALPVGEQGKLREPQVGETIEYKVGTEAQFASGFTGILVLTSTAE